MGILGVSDENDIDWSPHNTRAEDPTKFQTVVQFVQAVWLVVQSILIPWGLAIAWTIWAGWIILDDPTFVAVNAVWLSTGALTILGRFIFYYFLVKGIVAAQQRNTILTSRLQGPPISNQRLLRGLARYWLDVGTIGVGMTTTVLGFPQLAVIYDQTLWAWAGAAVTLVLVFVAASINKSGEMIDQYFTERKTYSFLNVTLPSLSGVPFWAMVIRSGLGFLTLFFVGQMGRSVS